mmetsp:Transcript_63021/g.75780  ORF Transcript_63021/g.75780 Transcript_63021/m.75780 type:complete len:112 (-) Transcript_63021:17-352(-)
MDDLDHNVTAVKCAMNKCRTIIDLSVIKDIELRRIEERKQTENDMKIEQDAELSRKLLSKKASVIEHESAILIQQYVRRLFVVKECERHLIKENIFHSNNSTPSRERQKKK